VPKTGKLIVTGVAFSITV